jgi:hypothetical protein
LLRNLRSDARPDAIHPGEYIAQELKELGFPPELSRQMKILVNPSSRAAYLAHA